VEARYGDGSGSAAAGATCAAYSFYVSKNLTTGEGGMLVTDEDWLADDARIRRLHGLDNDAWKRYASGAFGRYELECPGFKYNMTDVQAAIGIHQLLRLWRSHERRRAVWDRYNEAFAGLAQAEIPPASVSPDAGGVHARHLYTLWIDWEETRLTREELVGGLRDRGVGTGWHFAPVHLQKYYRRKYGYEPGSYPVTEWIGDRTVSLPLSAALTDDQVDRVIESVGAVLRPSTVGLVTRR
jgi:dTDP-4-amino-4,6-dideoxygalactose transaminase